jgi:hypothetical protein
MTFLLGFAIFKRPKPIYLKPKHVDAQNQGKANGPIIVEKQELDEDNDVIRNEVKNIRQAAVAESIRENAGAVDIISNWLDDENEVTEQKANKKDDESNKDGDSDGKDSDKKGKKKKK